MPMHNRGLTKLAEECGELIAAAMKAAAMHDAKPGEDIHWDGKPLKARLEEEMGDVIAAINYAGGALGLSKDRVNARAEYKFATYKTWNRES